MFRITTSSNALLGSSPGWGGVRWGRQESVLIKALFMSDTQPPSLVPFTPETHSMPLGPREPAAVWRQSPLSLTAHLR